jgi:CheY-like chemotaxis protein
MTEAKAKLAVMLVEDDPAHAELTLRSIEDLAPEHCEVVHVHDGQEAIDRLRRARADASLGLPDLVLLDLRLPRLGGLEVLSLVQADAQLKRIPVVVLTTSDAESDRQRAIACGASSYLVKPFGESELLAVTRVLGCQGFCGQRSPSS